MISTKYHIFILIISYIKFSLFPHALKEFVRG